VPGRIDRRHAIVVPLEMQRRRRDDPVQVLQRRPGVEHVRAPAVRNARAGAADSLVFDERRAVPVGPRQRAGHLHRIVRRFDFFRMYLGKNQRRGPERRPGGAARQEFSSIQIVWIVVHRALLDRMGKLLREDEVMMSQERGAAQDPNKMRRNLIYWWYW